jgi:hypothetical protein
MSEAKRGARPFVSVVLIRPGADSGRIRSLCYEAGRQNPVRVLRALPSMLHLTSRARHLPADLVGQSSALLVIRTSCWGPLDEATAEALRAELTALKTALLVIGADDLFYFNAQPSGSALPGTSASSSVGQALRRARGLGGGAPSDVLSLIEPDGRERFRLSRRSGGDLAEALLDALRIARQSVNLEGSLRWSPERELRLYSLVGALNLVLSEGAAAEVATQDLMS